MVARTEQVQTYDVNGDLTVGGVDHKELPVRAGALSRGSAAGGSAPKSKPEAGGDARREHLLRMTYERSERLAADREVIYALRRQELGDARAVVKPTFLRLSALRKGSLNRDLSDPKITQFATTLNWESFVALAVQDNGDGTYTVLDGHHRFEAVKRVYRVGGVDPLVPCVVQKKRLLALAAGTVHDINAVRTAWKATSLFWLRVDAEDATARKLVAVLASFGLAPVARDSSMRSPSQGQVSGIVALEGCAHKAGVPSASQTVAVLKRAFGSAPEAYRAPLIRGVWDFLLRYADSEQYRSEVLTGALCSTTPDGLIDEMNTIRRANKDKSEQEAMAEAIFMAYSSFEPRRHHPALPGWTTEPTQRAKAVRLAERARAYRKRHGD